MRYALAFRPIWVQLSPKNQGKSINMPYATSQPSHVPLPATSRAYSAQLSIKVTLHNRKSTATMFIQDIATLLTVPAYAVAGRYATIVQPYFASALWDQQFFCCAVFCHGRGTTPLFSFIAKLNKKKKGFLKKAHLRLTSIASLSMILDSVSVLFL